MNSNFNIKLLAAERQYLTILMQVNQLNLNHLYRRAQKKDSLV